MLGIEGRSGKAGKPNLFDPARPVRKPHTARSDHVTAAWIVATVDGSTYHDTAEEAERVAAELVSRVRAERVASGSRLPVREPLVYRIEVEGEGDAA